MLSSQSKNKTTKKSSKMIRKRERGEFLVAPEIPLDLLIEILKRLPAKSLARFKCVSKLWSSLISSQGSFFPSPPRLYISSLSRVKHNYELLSFSLVSTSKSSTVFDLDLKKQGVCGYDIVALRGLILYTVCEQACICNPTTGQRVVLPTIKFKMAKRKYRQQQDYFLGYDPVLDQYKVACTIVWSEMYTEHWVFLLESGSSWKRIKFNHPHVPMRQRVCINGVIYYVAFSTVYRLIAISYDVSSEEFNMIQIPSMVYNYLNSWHLELIQYGGKPTLFDPRHQSDQSVSLNLWVLEDAGKWSKKSLVLQSCHMHFFPSNIHFNVIGTTQNGEVVLKPVVMSYPYYILYYDLHKNDVKRIDITRISGDPLFVALMDFGESIMHLKI